MCKIVAQKYLILPNYFVLEGENCSSCPNWQFTSFQKGHSCILPFLVSKKKNFLVTFLSQKHSQKNKIKTKQKNKRNFRFNYIWIMLCFYQGFKEISIKNISKERFFSCCESTLNSEK